jgi:flagellar transcriptional activator FlhD
MEPQNVASEIRELNLSYLMLAREMLREDRAAAIYRLGVSREVAEMLEGLSAAQILKMAAANVVLCRFRLDDRVILEMVTNHGRAAEMSPSHAAILLAGRAPECAAA